MSTKFMQPGLVMELNYHTELLQKLMMYSMELPLKLDFGLVLLQLSKFQQILTFLGDLQQMKSQIVQLTILKEQKVTVGLLPPMIIAVFHKDFLHFLQLELWMMLKVLNNLQLHTDSWPKLLLDAQTKLMYIQKEKPNAQNGKPVQMMKELLYV